jgi:serine/threonine protein kinase
MLSQDQGKADTFSLVTTWLHVLSGIPPWFWLWRDAANEPMIVYKAMLQGYGLKEVLSKELAVRYAHMLSPGALAFFQEALVIDPKQRPTPAQLLEHPYLADAVDS